MKEQTIIGIPEDIVRFLVDMELKIWKVKILKGA